MHSRWQDRAALPPLLMTRGLLGAAALSRASRFWWSLVCATDSNWRGHHDGRRPSRAGARSGAAPRKAPAFSRPQANRAFKRAPPHCDSGRAPCRRLPCNSRLGLRDLRFGWIGGHHRFGWREALAAIAKGEADLIASDIEVPTIDGLRPRERVRQGSRGYE